MSKPGSAQVKQLAEAATAFQKLTTGHAPSSATVVLGENTLVITLSEALSPAEKVMAQSVDGAARLNEFHRQLFASSAASLTQEIQRITGRQVREATVELEPASGAFVHAFTTGDIVQVFQLTPIKTATADSGPSP